MTINIWTFGPEPEKAAIARAKEIGMKDPEVVRTQLVEGSRINLVAVILRERES